MSLLHKWAHDWDIHPAALEDLRTRMGTRAQYLLHRGGADAVDEAEGSEGRAQSEVRLEGAQKGVRLWRNNVGACVDDKGNFIRYGLANDSKKLNAVFKSSDLIGLAPTIVRPDMVGQTFGMFVAREIKQPGWVYKGTDRERAQKAFIDFVNSQGGDAAFCTGVGSL